MFRICVVRNLGHQRSVRSPGSLVLVGGCKGFGILWPFTCPLSELLCACDPRAAGLAIKLSAGKLG